MPALAAQDGAVLPADTPVLKEAGGIVLATLPRGTRVRAAAPVDGWSVVVLEGWVSSRSLGPDNRDGFDLAVKPAGGENLRSAPNGTIVARLRSGTLLARVETRAGWTHVRRSGVVAAAAFGSAPDSARPAAPVAAGTPAPDAAGRAEFARSAPLALSPEGTAVGTLGPGASAVVLGRTNDWVHVQVDGWVRDRDLKPLPAGITGGVTAAAVRATPEKFTGATVEWRVQYIAIRTADELRPDLAEGQLYVLARGPLPEPGFVYVTVTAEQADRFRQLSPLAEVNIRAIIRTPRSKYIGTPIVELAGIVGGV